jgi:Integrase zinc binding domain
MIFSPYVWPNLASDVMAWVRDCTDCQRTQVMKQLASAIQPIPLLVVGFSRIHVDWTPSFSCSFPLMAMVIY